MKTIVINLFGGPGIGKSTMMAGLYHELKSRGINCEMAPEYAKDKVWEKSFHVLGNQLYLLGHQHHRIWRLVGQVDVIITDSPILLSLYYGRTESAAFKRLVVEAHEGFDSWNIFLMREKPFVQAGRVQGENEARQIDRELVKLLTDYNIPYDIFPGNRELIGKITDEAIFKRGLGRA